MGGGARTLPPCKASRTCSPSHLCGSGHPRRSHLDGRASGPSGQQKWFDVSKLRRTVCEVYHYPSPFSGDYPERSVHRYVLRRRCQGFEPNGGCVDVADSGTEDMSSCSAHSAQAGLACSSHAWVQTTRCTSLSCPVVLKRSLLTFRFKQVLIQVSASAAFPHCVLNSNHLLWFAGLSGQPGHCLATVARRQDGR